jgi:hypothetical protein
MPTYGSYIIDRPIETARGGGHAQPASVADAAVPHGWGLKGGDTHATRAQAAEHHMSMGTAPSVASDSTRQRAARDWCTVTYVPAAAPIRPHTDAAHSTPSCVHHAPVHPSILPQVVLVGPVAPQEARWPIRVVYEVGSMGSLYLVASVAKCSIHTTSESGPIPPAWPRGDALVAATFVPIVAARCQRGERKDAQGDD